MFEHRWESFEWYPTASPESPPPPKKKGVKRKTGIFQLTMFDVQTLFLLNMKLYTPED